MYIALLYDNNVNSNIVASNNLINYYEKLKSMKKRVVEINFVQNSSKNHKGDPKIEIYIIFSNYIEVIKNLTKNIKNKKAKIIIVTDNINSCHINKCISITPYLCYMKSGPNAIIKKIYQIINI